MTLTQHVPAQISELFAQLSTSQQRYLALLPTAPSPHEAARQAGFKPATLRVWRYRSPAFRRCEQAIRDYTSNYAATLATNLAKAHSAQVMQQLIELATRDASTDRQLTAKQRAAETVLRAAGVLDMPAGLTANVERIDVIAMRLWTRSSPAIQPPEGGREETASEELRLETDSK